MGERVRRKPKAIVDEYVAVPKELVSVDSSDRYYLSDTMMLRNEGEVEDL